MPAFVIFPDQNVAAAFDDAPGGGDVQDFNAPRNRPVREPWNWVDHVYWHSEFFQYELAMPIQSVTVSHPSISGRSQDYSIPNLGFVIHGRVSASNITLVNHNLGYTPLAFVVYNGRMVMPGTIVQTASNHRVRMVAPYATNSVIGIRDQGITTDQNLGSVSRSYQVMVFRVPIADVTQGLLEYDNDDLIIGRGKINTLREYLRQVGPGDSPFIISIDRTIDIRNGRTRTVIGGQTATDTGYNGNFSGSDYLTVGV